MIRILLLGGMAVGLAVTQAAAQARAACTLTIGSVVSLTGPAGAYGQAAAKSIELAFKDINDAGGVKVGGQSCELAAEFRDDQSQGAVAVDAARQLVDLKKVPVIIGGIISSVSMPILTSVTAPSGIVQISPASSSPSFTELAAKGETKGFWFRTITSDALQGVVAAKYAIDSGLNKLSIIRVNNDFGLNMVKEFEPAFKKLGGTIVSITPYNESQASYASEVTRALEGDPEALYLVSYPGDGATIARQWISQGGPQKFLLNDGMNSEEFIKNVGADYLKGAIGTSSGTSTTPSTEYFQKAFGPFTGGKFDSGAPAADRAYDAAAIIGLTIDEAGSADPVKIRDAIRKVVAINGTKVFAGPDGMRSALSLIAQDKPIRYVGVIGPIEFDKNGDITGPFRLWRIKDGKVVTTGEMSEADVAQLKAKVGE